MTDYASLVRRNLKRSLIVCLLIVAVFLCYRAVRAEMHRSSLIAVDIDGSQHIGRNFNIADFYVNGYDAGNIGREGFGGGMCCVLLPKKWRPGLVVEVRWSIGDWTKENLAEIDAGNYRSIHFTCFKAMVPVEKYETAERLYVHFFSGGKVRVLSSSVGVLGATHPIQRDDIHAADIATVGKRIDAIFDDAEMKDMQRRNENRSNFFGDWR